MDRRDKLLDGLDLKSAVGVEIGPLCRPVIKKSDGQIVYVDHTDTASLRAKYQADPSVPVDDIVNVDAVWGEQSLQEALGRARQFDYVLASHVVEHVPDMVTWFEEFESILKPHGEVRLAVPDRRYSFDYLRKESRLADVLTAYMYRARIPLPHSILDFMLNAAEVNVLDAWDGKVDEDRLSRFHDFSQAMAVARDADVNHRYHDVHCWVFTPASFAELFEALARVGLMKFRCARFFDTDVNNLEFFVILARCEDQTEAVASWRRMREALTQAKPPKALLGSLRRRGVRALRKAASAARRIQG